MSNIAIRVEKISKQYRYRIGSRAERYFTLRDSISKLGANIIGFFSNNGREEVDEKFFWALRDVSFEVKPGEIMGIVGPNGAGKTTLLKILSRITEPTEGRAEIYGRVGSLLEVGTGFHPELTGRENIYLSGAILGMKKAETHQKFDEIVAFADVEKFIDTPVKHYSSGMYLRLAFAVAAHLEPEILLVDEVLAVGDAEFQKKCLGKMNEILDEGRTILFVSHNMLSVRNLCNRGILLESGKISMDSDIGSVLNKYLDRGGQTTGEISWQSSETAPGDQGIRLKAVRVVCEGVVSGNVDISKAFSIEIEYWNLKPNSRQCVSVHLHNAMGILLFASANFPSASLALDPWYDRPYPVGVFRTSCTIPGYLLNNGKHGITVFIKGLRKGDVNFRIDNVLSFDVQDTGETRKEHTYNWQGAVRPRLAWQTIQLE